MVRPNLTNCVVSALCITCAVISPADLLLLHQFRVWTIVDNILAEYRRSQRSIDFLRIDILVFRVQDEVVTLCSKTHSSLLAEENERKDITVLLRHASVFHNRTILLMLRRRSSYLFPTCKEELVGIDTVANGTPNNWKEVKDHRRLMRITQEDLIEDIDHDGEDEKGCDCGEDECDSRRRRGESLQRSGDNREDTHGRRGKVERGGEAMRRKAECKRHTSDLLQGRKQA